MGLFGGSSNDTSSGLDFSGANSSNYGSKLRSSGSELDLSDFDSSGSASGSAAGDLQMSLQREQQKALLMSAIHKITDNCWDICVDSVGSSLSKRTETCLSNCSDRFVDTTLLITNRFAQLASKIQPRH